MIIPLLDTEQVLILELEHNPLSSVLMLDMTRKEATYSGSYNLFAGYGAGQHIGGDSVVALGAYAGYYTTGSSNTFVGKQAGYGGTTSAPYSSGQYNVAIGTESS